MHQSDEPYFLASIHAGSYQPDQSAFAGYAEESSHDGGITSKTRDYSTCQPLTTPKL